MFKYFKNKLVHVKYIYQNSLGTYYVREKTLTYNNFEIIQSHEDFNILLKNKNKILFEQELSIYWEFTGLGTLKFCNSGPYCYFTIKKIFNAKNLLKTIIETITRPKD
jgi:hypothetical protein